MLYIRRGFFEIQPNMRQATFILLSILLSFCGKTQKNKTLVDYYSNTCKSIDSIITFSENHPNYLKALSNSVIRFYYSGDHSKARELLERAKNSEKIAKNPVAQQYQYSDWGFYYLWEQKYDSCKLQINQWQALNHTDTINHLIGIQLIGNYHYIINNLDSSRYYFSEGYRLSKFYTQESSTERFANNLGAIAFQSGLYATAASYFSEASLINKKSNKINAVLTNNLAACYLNESKIQLAYDLLKTLQNELDLKNNTYEGFLTRLNYLEALINLNQIEEAKTYIHAFQWDDIPKSLKGEYLVNVLNISKAENWKDLPSLFEKYQTDFAIYNTKLLHKFGNGLIDLYKINPKIYGLLEIDNLEVVPDKLSMNALHFYYHLKSLESQKRGNVNEALVHILESNQSLVRYNKLTDSLKIVDTESKINFAELEDKFRLSQIELSHTKDINKQNKTIIILISILAVIFLGLGYYIYQNRNQKIKLAALELEAKTAETAFLVKEQRLNSRILSLSKIIIDKSKHLAETIKQGPYSNEPEIHAVRKELEQLSLIDAAVNLQAANEIFETKVEYLEFAAFKELNETQQRILVLSVENYKAKEIATALNLSYAYVRNVQTKLRKILNSLNIESFKEVKDFIK